MMILFRYFLFLSLWVLLMAPGASGQTLKKAFEEDQEKFKLYTGLLYNQARLIEGLPIEDPVEFTNQMIKIMK